MIMAIAFFATPDSKAQDASSCEAGIKITPAAGEYGDGFGSSVSLDANTAVIGIPGGDAIYVLARDSGSWSLQEKLTGGIGWFGMSVAVSGDTIAVGAPYETGGLYYYSGAVYIFERINGLWTERAKLAFDDPDVSRFGESVALAGDTLAIGAPGAGHGAAQDAGGVYIYVRSGGTWMQEAVLTAHDPMSMRYMGSSVSLSGDTVVAGAIRDEDHGYESGAAYVFTRSGGTWTEQAKLAPEGIAAFDRFGWSVSLSGDMLAVSSPFHDSGSTDAGSVTLFHRDGGVWTEEATLIASDPMTWGLFGSSVSLDGDLLAVGAMWGGSAQMGEAHLFSICGGTWREQAKLAGNDGWDQTWLGYAIALSGDTLFVGAPHDSPYGSGSAFVFTGCTAECHLPCPRSQDYWKTHPSDWPVIQFPLGEHNYSKGDLQELLSMPARGDASVILSHQLIVTFLNLVLGSDPVPVAQAFSDSYALLSSYPARLPYGVRPSTAEGREMTALSESLDQYNGGLLTPDCIKSTEASDLTASQSLPAIVGAVGDRLRRGNRNPH